MTSKKRTRVRPRDMKERLAAASRAVARGATVQAACRWSGISEPTYYRWRKEAAATAEPGDAERASRTREAILTAARTVFLRDGFDAGLQTVAAAAGVSRRTIYNLYGDRERLFGEVVHALHKQHISPALVVGIDGDLPSALAACALQQIRHSLDPEVIGLMRITLQESRTRPELAALAYAMRADSGAATMTAAIARRLDDEIERGAITAVDTVLAAQTFVGSCTAHLRHRALIGLEPPTELEIQRRLEMALDIFLKGLEYAPSAAPIVPVDRGVESG